MSKSVLGDTVLGGARKWRGTIAGGIVVVAGLALALLLYLVGSGEPGRQGGSQAAGRGAVPVTIATAERQDVPIYFTGLGTVQAWLTVEIHSKVDGELQQVLFAEGQHVQKGDVLAKIDPRLFQAALDQAKAKRAQDAAMLVAAEKDMSRANTLALKSVETQQNVDQQRARVDQLKASIAADEAAMETAQTQLDYATIVAPSDGRIGIRLLDPGNTVHASDVKPIVNLVLTQPCAVVYTLPATDLTQLRESLRRGPVEVTAFDQDSRIALGTGHLMLIDNTIDQSTATVRLKAMFANDDEALWPGEFVNARTLVETRQHALTVPTAAIQNGADGLFTWVVTANNVAEPRTIKVGPAADDVTIITAGLTDGDRVVIAGQYKLQPKAPVVAALAPRASPARPLP